MGHSRTDISHLVHGTVLIVWGNAAAGLAELNCPSDRSISEGSACLLVIIPA